jgi:redox-sensitive bicupin YhaK (pirin superfamily)
MTTPRTVVREIVPEPTTEGGGVRLRRLIAGKQIDWLDPFLLLDHFRSDDPADFVRGFPMHPHRGIETVTYLLEGEIDHRDTTGSAGTLCAGGVQWMTAGGGVMHEEMPRPSAAGRLDGFQLWVNLPARLKMSRPRYQEFGADEIPEVRRDGSVIRVIAGEMDGVRGPVCGIAMQPSYLDVHLGAHAHLDHNIPRGHAAFAYVYRGVARLGRDRSGKAANVVGPALAVLDDGDTFRAEAGAAGARYLLVSGAPTGEPIARYGPFVMNSNAEILEALNDLNRNMFIWREGRE